MPETGDYFQSGELRSRSTPLSLIEEILDFVELKPDELFVDAGCGEGIVVEWAVSKYKVRAIGIEINEKLAIEAKRRIEKAGIKNKVDIIIKDFYDFNFGCADVVYLYLPSIDAKLVSKLKEELKHGARVISLVYSLPGFGKPKEKTFHLYDETGGIFPSVFIYEKRYLMV